MAAEAARADLDADGVVADVDDLLVKVGAEGAIRARRLPHPAAGVLVADVAAKGRAFSTDGADRGHGYLNLVLEQPVLESGTANSSMRQKAEAGVRALGLTNIDVRAGFAESIPVADETADVGRWSTRDWAGS